MEQVTGPGNAARNSWQVANNWWVALVLVVLLLNRDDLHLVVLEENGVLLGQVGAQVVTVNDGLELAEELQVLFDVVDDFEVLVNVLLESGLN